MSSENNNEDEDDLGSPIVDTVEVGGIKLLSRKETICAVFHEFESEVRGDQISPPLQCHGHEWRITVVSRPGIDHIQVYLLLTENTSEILKVKFSLRIGSKIKRIPMKKFARASLPEEERDRLGVLPCYGSRHFLLLSRILDRNNGYLDENGSLKVYATIQIEQTNNSTGAAFAGTNTTWTPPRGNLVNDMRRLLESGENADVVFIVGSNDQEESHRFPAHKNILKSRSNTFKEMLEDVVSSSESDNNNNNNNNNNKVDEIPIHGVEPIYFRLLLYFLYTDEVSSEFHNPSKTQKDDNDTNHILHHYQTILEVANKFDCLQLKLLAEAQMIDLGVTTENAAELLVFADSHCCALLREKAIQVFISKPKHVMASSGWSTHIQPSADLLNELVQVVFQNDTTISSTTTPPNCHKRKRGNDDGDDDNSSDYSNLQVTELRKRLYQKGLDLDGTREMLIARLSRAENDDDE